MSRLIWATFEGLVGLLIGAFFGYLLAWGCIMICDLLKVDLPRESRVAILILFLTVVSTICAITYAKRSLDAFDGKGKTGRSILTGKDGKPEFKAHTLAAFICLALAWAFLVLIMQTWGRH